MIMRNYARRVNIGVSESVEGALGVKESSMHEKEKHGEMWRLMKVVSKEKDVEEDSVERCMYQRKRREETRKRERTLEGK